MVRMFTSSMLAAAAVIAVSALAFADETVIEKRTYESGTVPAPAERVIEERQVVQEPPVVKKRTDTVVTTTSDNDNE